MTTRGILGSFSSLFGGNTSQSTQHQDQYQQNQYQYSPRQHKQIHHHQQQQQQQHQDHYQFRNQPSTSTSKRPQPGAKSSQHSSWSLPTTYPNGPASATQSSYPPPSPANSQFGSQASPRYPPVEGTMTSASDSVANLANASSHALVAPRRSLSVNTQMGLSIPSTSFPPLRQTWSRIRHWSDSHYPELKDTLNWPATDVQLDDLELAVGFSLPAAVRESYLCHNGQEIESNQSCSDGVFFGLQLLSVDRIAEEWRFWRSVDEDPTSGANAEVRQWQTSCPDQWVRSEYSCRGWIPLITDHVGNYIGVDLTPQPNGGGAPGQVIVFGRDFDSKVVLWRGDGEGGWARFLQYFAEELESGELWTLEEASSGSEDEEDAIGYESYFSGGGSGAGKGGGEAAGEGSAGFRLTGEYKGWPVLEAWADRSIRCWEEVGLQMGVPAAAHAETPNLRLTETDDEGQTYDVDPTDPYRSRDSRNGSVDSQAIEGLGVSHPLQGGSGRGASVPGEIRRGSAGSYVDVDGRPFAAQEAFGGSQAGLGPRERNLADSLQPPVRSLKAPRPDGGKGKQREASSSAAQAQTARRKAPPPAPVAALDLPTLQDVQAVRAAALAENQRSTQVLYSDLGQATRGIGGLNLGRNGTIRPNSYNANLDPMVNGAHRSLRRSETPDALEMDSRTSSDGLRRQTTMGSSRSSSGGLHGVVVVGEPRHSLQSPTIASPRLSGEDASRFSSDGRQRLSVNYMDGSLPSSPALGVDSSRMRTSFSGDGTMSSASSTASHMGLTSSGMGGPGGGAGGRVSPGLFPSASAARTPPITQGGNAGRFAGDDSNTATPTATPSQGRLREQEAV